MKKFLLFALLIIVCGCGSDDNNETTYEEDLEALVSLSSEIEDLANSSVCNETTECKYIAWGSKPCGGPWVYLIYSTSIDEAALVNMVEEYNQKEATFNNKWERVSDCLAVSPPTSLNCENNTCVAVY